jgi:hypothetical protein
VWSFLAVVLIILFVVSGFVLIWVLLGAELDPCPHDRLSRLDLSPGVVVEDCHKCNEHRYLTERLDGSWNVGEWLTDDAVM